MSRHHDDDNRRREENKEIRIKEKNEAVSKKRNMLVIKLTATLIVIAILGLSIKGFASNEKSSSASSIVPVEAVMVNSVQEVNLTWGKSNYYPEIIKVKSGIPVKIIADTNRLTGCFQYIQIPQLGVKKYVNGDDNVIEFTPKKPGRYKYSCYMGMGYGTLVVE